MIRRTALTPGYLLPLALAGSLLMAPPPVRAEEPAAGTVTPFSAAPPGTPPGPWHFVTLPNKVATRYTIVDLNGERVLKVEANQSYGNLAHPLRLSASDHTTLSWRWRVDKLVEAADLTQRSGDDAAAKLCLSFDFSPEHLGFAERAKLRLARSATGEEVPAETLCYVWDNKLPAGSRIVNAFTRRLRLIVLQTGPQKLGQWVAEKRNVVADYQRVFGDESTGPVPDIVDVVVSADADNTQGNGLAYFGDIRLAP
ncbi:DUF3047 domain-containing protein [Variovorax terrae]|uniref:DUF3047 domain-containing protein n=1 Tax=Variovorax terrae TaxID=2923278 RepID=A0A9X2APE1_9BURK|nr:DUF3047 domain-containing protein [Variovorax terrae]MCJ0765708.1 DUF3047 domain-containing protein [Variovorax terrae]